MTLANVAVVAACDRNWKGDLQWITGLSDARMLIRIWKRKAK